MRRFDHTLVQAARTVREDPTLSHVHHMATAVVQESWDVKWDHYYNHAPIPRFHKPSTLHTIYAYRYGLQCRLCGILSHVPDPRCWFIVYLCPYCNFRRSCFISRNWARLGLAQQRLKSAEIELLWGAGLASKWRNEKFRLAWVEASKAAKRQAVRDQIDQHAETVAELKSDRTGAARDREEMQARKYEIFGDVTDFHYPLPHSTVYTARLRARNL